MPKAYLNIGSNQGDRRALIERAVALIAHTYPGAAIRMSDYIETEAWGYQSEARYLNLGISVDMAVLPEPLDMLERIQSIERMLSDVPHRLPDGSYRDREIDIDIIAIEGVRMSCRRLTLPHPRARERQFVIDPLVQLTGIDRLGVIQTILS